MHLTSALCLGHLSRIAGCPHQFTSGIPFQYFSQYAYCDLSRYPYRRSLSTHVVSPGSLFSTCLLDSLVIYLKEHLSSNLQLQFSDSKCTPRCFLPVLAVQWLLAVIPLLYVIALQTIDPLLLLQMPYWLVRLHYHDEFPLSAEYFGIVETESELLRLSQDLIWVCILCMRLLDWSVGAYPITPQCALFDVLGVQYLLHYDLHLALLAISISKCVWQYLSPALLVW